MFDLYLFPGLFLLGAVVGSFLNVLILRYGSERGVVIARSACPHCGLFLRWWELVPIFSFILLLGKCARCRQQVSFQYPVVELVSGITLMIIATPLPTNILAGAAAALTAIATFILIVLFGIDLLTFLLPDLYVFLLLAVVILRSIIIRASVIDAALGVIVGAGFLMTLWVITRGQGIGLGDVKLLIPLGIFFGMWGVVTLLFISFVVGGAVGLFLLLTKRATTKTAVPFGPYLTGAAILLIVLPSLPEQFFNLLLG